MARLALRARWYLRRAKRDAKKAAKRGEHQKAVADLSQDLRSNDSTHHLANANIFRSLKAAGSDTKAFINALNSIRFRPPAQR